MVFAEGGYDRERYQELREISLKLMAKLANQPLADLKGFFVPQEDYPTPKVDVRGFVLNEKDEILMARESVDGKWTIPGGWADVGISPREVAIKEIKEETGLDTKIMRLVAVYDKQRHLHPPEPLYVYKLIFHCKVIVGELCPGFDMRGANWFALNRLPPLSEDRILESQLHHLFGLVKENIQDAYTD